ncbi:MAG: thermonuclease family protein, partial [Chloroflexota bacterium]|nr:thermonuclease family protein [Chloroflexota bacterium]
LRSAILAVVVFTGLYFGQDSLPANVNFSIPAGIEQRLGLTDDADTADVSQVPGGAQDLGAGSIPETPVATEADSDGTSGPPNSDQIGASDDNDDGIGGQDGEITPVNPSIGEYTEPTSEPAVEDQVDEGQSATEPVDEQPPVVEPTAPPIEPTSPPVTVAPATDAPATSPPVMVAPATDAPATSPPVSVAPATDAPATELPVSESPMTEAPVTEEPATEPPVTEVPATVTPVPGQPTEVPGRQDPTATATPDEEPTEMPTTEAPEPTLESQPASVDPGSTPEQALASGEFRYSITGAARGETVDELPDLNAVGLYGEWVVLSMYGQNWSDSEQVFDMAEFKLYADGEEALVDVGNAWVSGLLGHTPAYGNTDAILWAAEEGHPFALTFLAPPDAQQLTLVAGEQTIDLSAALANPAPLAQDGGAAPLPEYLDADVVDVLSAEEIVIELDGIEQTVRYLGLDVPTGDDCFASDATTANQQLVAGKTVRLERQATDVDARGNWVRDVWAPAEDGRYFLVSEALVAEGAATVGISEPNTRYEGWLMGSQSIAKAEGRGLWGDCQGESTDTVAPLAAIAPAPNRLTFRRVVR